MGFDWDHIEEMWEKFFEEEKEFQEAIQQNDRFEMENEFGDILFVLANIAKYYQVNPEIALAKANQKFLGRFNEVERQAIAAGNALSDLSFAELNVLWNQAKEKERD